MLRQQASKNQWVKTAALLFSPQVDIARDLGFFWRTKMDSLSREECVDGSCLQKVRGGFIP